MPQRSPIRINPAHKGEFTAKAAAVGMTAQAFARRVLSAPKGQYSDSTREQANFARNAKSFKH